MSFILYISLIIKNKLNNLFKKCLILVFLNLYRKNVANIIDAFEDELTTNEIEKSDKNRDIHYKTNLF